MRQLSENVCLNLIKILFSADRFPINKFALIGTFHLPNWLVKTHYIMTIKIKIMISDFNKK